MSFFSATYSVTAGTPVQVVSAGADPDRTVCVSSDSSAGQALFGLSNTTAVFPMGHGGNSAGAPTVFVLPGGYELWLDCASGTNNIQVLITRA